jgi:predicted ribosomally synthesized peptide with SipW-like signal peptide
MKTKKPIISFLITIISLISITAVGTSAFFNAQKNIAANKFAAGTLDLDVTATDNINQPISISDIGGVDKMSGSRSWKIRNVGTLPGKLVFNLANINNLENGCNTPEIETEPNCESDNIGELGKAIKITASINNEQIAQSTLENGHDFIYDKALILQPSSEYDLTINWQENEAGYGNEIQSDTTNFDMIFKLEQQQ